MSRAAKEKRDWKTELYSGVFGEEREAPQHSEESIAFVLETLKDRERSIVLMRYKDRKTFREIAEEYHLTSSRIQQIFAKSLRKLRHPSRKRVLEVGIEQVQKEKEDLKRQFNERTMEQKNLTLEEYDITIRPYNCLKRAGLNDRNDVLCYIKERESESPPDALLHIRNLGRKSAIEILEKLNIQ